jgi:hypothetical protein
MPTTPPFILEEIFTQRRRDAERRKILLYEHQMAGIAVTLRRSIAGSVKHHSRLESRSHIHFSASLRLCVRIFFVLGELRALA